MSLFKRNLIMAKTVYLLLSRQILIGTGNASIAKTRLYFLNVLNSFTYLRVHSALFCVGFGVKLSANCIHF